MPILPLGLFEDLGNSFYKTFIVEDRYLNFLSGLGNTLLITLFATILGILIGLIIAVIKVSYAQARKKNIFLSAANAICSAYVAVIRGTPMVVQLLIMYFVVFVSFSADQAIIVAILAFGINSGAYVSEIVRGGILAVDRGQMEAGRSLGLTYGQTMTSIILPQAVKSILPALGNEFIVLLKETSIVGYIGLVDLTRAADIVKSRTFEAFFPLISIAIVYFLLVMGLSAILKRIERRLAKSDRR